MVVSNDTTMVSNSLGATLLGRTREAVIGVLFSSPAPLHQREIVRRSGMPLAPVQRELATLVRLGVLTEERAGNQKMYRPNPASPIFAELKGLASKTFGIAGRLRASLERFRELELAFIFGSIAAGSDTATSDIDLLAVGNLSHSVVSSALQDVARELGRPISLKLYRPSEFREKLAAGNEFLTGVVDGPKLFVVGTEEVLYEYHKAQVAQRRSVAEPKGAQAYKARGLKSSRARGRAPRRG